MCQIALSIHFDLFASELASNPALLFLDLDHFNHVNDSLGHDAGDQLLIEVAARLPRALQPAALLARLGGDEFVVVLSQTTDVDEVTAVAERILAGGQFRTEVAWIQVVLVPSAQIGQLRAANNGVIQAIYEQRYGVLGIVGL